MMKRMTIISLLLLSVSVLLAACGTTSDDQRDTGEKTIYVGPQLVDCEGVAPQQCLLVKEDPQAEYTLYYDQIEGFDYGEGYEYELRIKEEAVENPPADASTIKWTLVEEVSKTPVEAIIADTPPQDEETETAASGEEMTMYVGPELVDCEGAGPQSCMLVKMNPEDDYMFFYDQIEGFTFEPGFEYELLVLVEQVENPPADASSLKYTLIEEVDKLPVTEESATTEESDTEDGDVALEESTLEDTNWILVSYIAPDGQSADVLPDTRITAEFNEDQIAGSAGCNRYFGSYEVDGDSLTINPGGSSMMFCTPEEIMLQETAYMATLSTVASYEFIDTQLHLKNANGEAVLIFAADEPLLLTDVIWNLVSYNNGKEAMVSVIIDSEITAKFNEDGVLTGFAGCNSYSAGYETEGSSITVGLAVSTEMFCAEPEGVMEQETQYLTALQDAAVYRIEGDRLEIRDADGSGVAYYEAAEPAALTGIIWNLLSHNNGKEAMVSTVIGTEITANFNEDGTLSGSAGCNSYTASYKSDGEKITIGPAASTRKFCAEPEGIMEQESQYLTALENAAVYVIEGNKLEIRDANFSGVATYDSPETSATTDGAVGENDINVTEAAETLDTESAESDGASDATAVPAEITTALQNASFPLNYTGSGTIQLTDGEYRQPAAEDSASEIITQLTDHVATGEMSSGEQMVAIILTSQTGGTGTFYDLIVMNEQSGLLTNPISTYLGDRIVINNLTIENDQIIVDMVVQGPEDPFCCPTQQVVHIYEFQGGELLQVSSEVTGTVEPQSVETPEFAGVIWKWQELTTPVEQVAIDSPERYTIEFKEGGELSVSADCNIGSGTYEIEDENIAINITSTTLALCSEGSYGDLFFSSLDGASSYFMDGDNLMIEQVADGGTMRFFE